MLGLQLEIESVSRAHPGREPRDIYSAVDLKGDLPGRVVLDRALATVIVCEMLMAEPDEIEEDLIDGIGEMVNVLVGNAKTILERGNKTIVLTPPISQEGSPPKLGDASDGDGVEVRYSVSDHSMTLWISVAGIQEGVPAAQESAEIEEVEAKDDAEAEDVKVEEVEVRDVEVEDAKVEDVADAADVPPIPQPIADAPDTTHSSVAGTPLQPRAKRQRGADPRRRRESRRVGTSADETRRG